MDDGVLPPVGIFEVVSDGVPETPTALLWLSDTQLRLSITGGAPTTVVINLLSHDANLRNSDGILAAAPQSIQAIP